MKITVTKTKIPKPVAVIHLDGALNGSNFECLIDEAHKLHAAGIRDLILDLSKLTFISSAGLGALHQVALMYRGKNRPGKDEVLSDYRWAAFRTLDRSHKQPPHEHVKLFSPSKEVREVIDMIGFDTLFDIFTDLPQATASFQQSVPASENRPM